MCTILSIGNAIWEYQEGNSFIVFLPRADGANASLSAFLTFWSYVIILNTVVPISLYVRSELNLYYMIICMHITYLQYIVKTSANVLYFIKMTYSEVKMSESS